MTTRKHAALRRPRAWALLACLALGLAGCSTPGPTHAYLASRAEDPIIDLLPGTPDADIPTHLIPVNELYGIAYDPFTDHLFLRIFPGDFIRVIDRPARKIKRGILIKDLPPGRGDLAIRSSDRHLFFAHPSLPAVLETSLYGEAVRTVTLEGLQGPPAGVAYDQTNDRLLILEGRSPSHVVICDLDGKRLKNIPLNRAVRLVCLAYDSVAGEFYVPLLDQPAIGVFDANGHLLRTLATPDAGVHDFVDVGQRSLLRLF
ncbi:MAG: hypothetical protein K0R17_3282 [Rariglobus sp.]|nr:hypothetical protein [Rariglobus sp.]